MPKGIRGRATCAIPDCSKFAYGNGFCESHWRKDRLYGDPLVQRKAPNDALLNHLKSMLASEDRSTCWSWPFFLNCHGYPLVRFEGKPCLASAIALILDGRPKPPETEACHTCDNPSCTNPAHLYWGTHAQNMADMVSRDRSCRGERRPNAKLTDADVRAIRSDPRPQKVIAVDYRVTQPLVSQVKSRRRWRHVN